MSDPTHRMAFDAIGIAAQVLTPQAGYLTEFLAAEQAMHSHLHITDPTTYRDALNSRSFAQQVKLARAAAAFILAVQEVKAEIEAGAEAERADG